MATGHNARDAERASCGKQNEHGRQLPFDPAVYLWAALGMLLRPQLEFMAPGTSGCRLSYKQVFRAVPPDQVSFNRGYVLPRTVIRHFKSGRCEGWGALCDLCTYVMTSVKINPIWGGLWGAALVV